MQKVLLGMSGGVDSSVCAALLKQNGFLVGGVTLNLNDSFDLSNIDDAKAVCEKLGIEHITAQLKNEFKKYVIDNFIDEYISGNTPNPCIVCNKYIKFGKMLEIARQNGYQKIATGHYARIIERDGRYLLCKAKDITKDQTYVLYCLTQEQLASAVFPLGTLSKAQVREIAEKENFVSARKKDSQDICFVPDGDYANFIEKTANFVSQTGDYVNRAGEKIGQHKGVIHYTIGQRKGLGIALGKPAFVISKDAKTNRVVLGDQEFLFYKKVLVKDVNFIPFDKLSCEMEVTAKFRYSQKEQKAVIKPLDNGQVLVEFFEPQRAPSSGQAAVFYNGDIVVGGGTIICGIE
ncbi:MAG: tRNA 2-thiouridine(34) synthase MnmA [Ruminococcaceae bacterium]|nr:tRNA 2-thiouridine(34) synthase MnmA [Oscillospiraceae bacterium]